jgi:hypothetical protein
MMPASRAHDDEQECLEAGGAVDARRLLHWGGMLS